MLDLVVLVQIVVLITGMIGRLVSGGGVCCVALDGEGDFIVSYLMHRVGLRCSSKVPMRMDVEIGDWLACVGMR